MHRIVLGYTANVGIEELNKFSQVVPWYAVRTRCHHERKVVKLLEVKGFDVLLPKYRTWSRRKDRRKVIELPLFPGYVFVQMEPDHGKFREISRTFGVAYILGRKGKPEPIRKEEMDSLLILLRMPEKVRPHPYFKEGDRVIVVDGPFRGAIGYVMKVQPKKYKLIVGIEMLGRAVAVHVAEDVVEKY